MTGRERCYHVRVLRVHINAGTFRLRFGVVAFWIGRGRGLAGLHWRTDRIACVVWMVWCRCVLLCYAAGDRRQIVGVRDRVLVVGFFWLKLLVRTPGLFAGVVLRHALATHRSADAGGRVLDGGGHIRERGAHGELRGNIGRVELSCVELPATLNAGCDSAAPDAL